MLVFHPLLTPPPPNLQMAISWLLALASPRPLPTNPPPKKRGLRAAGMCVVCVFATPVHQYTDPCVSSFALVATSLEGPIGT